ncbi:Mismatch repair protein msh3 [Agyrium rufum]|nr:Mismatch repair protein msh3 [Agyrium rufum]
MPALVSSQTSKKQQSISNFFSKTTTPVKPQSQQLDSPKTNSSGHDADDKSSDGLFIQSDDEDVRDRRSTTPKRPRDLDESKQIAIRSPKRIRLNPEGSFDGKKTPEPLRPVAANITKKAKLLERTSQYLFSSSPACEEDNDDDEEAKRRKQHLHQRFVKKLGKPDSIADLRRKNGQVDDMRDGENADEEDDAEEEIEKPSKAKRPGGKKASSKLTPMEKQVLDIKSKHPDTLLVVEVGYKFRFFGEDARTAAKELGIFCIPGKMRFDEHPSEAHLDRFASASIPVHRLHVHVKRLVAAGHKVGVVRQLETAALKAVGDNRNAPFVRKLTNLYTKGTYIDDIEGLEGPSAGEGSSSTGYLLCLTESRTKGWGTDEKVLIGMLAVQPATGDIIYDQFEDGFMRSEIETRLLHLAPCELLVVGTLTKATEKLVQHLSGSKTNVFGDKIRVEWVDRAKTMAAEAYTHVNNFYAGKVNQDNESNVPLLEKVLKLPENVTICLSAMIKQMSDYGLEHVFDLTKYFQSFSARSHMLLNGTTVESLEIYRNQTDHTEKGSLFWTLDRTQTRFGQRLLRKWVGRPLLDRAKLEERVAAVEELKDGEGKVLITKVRRLLSKIKTDLEKSLIRIYYGKCTRPELLSVLQTLQTISAEFVGLSDQETGLKSPLINNAIASLPTIAKDVVSYLEKINPEAAKNDDKYDFFRDSEETEMIMEYKMGIISVEHDLEQHRDVAAEKVRKKKIDYVTVAGIEYLIEMDNTQLKNVPASWVKISGTKKVSRFHTPEVLRLIRERDQHKEALAAACDAAFATLLAEISSRYQSFRDCVQALATLDCLMSLATVAAQPGYVKPQYTDETCVLVEQGRHPMVEQLLLETYVPNDINLRQDGTRALLITGPNMGGKSSYVRQVALIAIMGQIGSYVPAESATLGMLDAVFTRMGAFDNMMAGESTFMVELSETSNILKQASVRSLVILDELGRGTSTHDGVAIAQAVLDHVVRETQCLTLFITHYQQLSSMVRGFTRGELQNRHMKFTESTGTGGEEDVTFLYEIGDGVAHRSYGLNVARLANIPKSVLDVASIKSSELEHDARNKQLQMSSTLLREALSSESEGVNLDDVIVSLENL